MEGETTGVDIKSSWLLGSVTAGLRGGFGTGIAMEASLVPVLPWLMEEGLDGSCTCCFPESPTADAVFVLFGELPVFTAPSRLIMPSLPSFLSFVSFVESIFILYFVPSSTPSLDHYRTISLPRISLLIVRAEAPCSASGARSWQSQVEQPPPRRVQPCVVFPINRLESRVDLFNS
jgi:hypothetical protein